MSRDLRFRVVKATETSTLSLLYEVGIPFSLCAALDIMPGALVLVESIKTGNKFPALVAELAINTPIVDAFVELHDATMSYVSLDPTDLVRISTPTETIPIANTVELHVEDGMDDHLIAQEHEFTMFVSGTLRSMQFLGPNTSLSLRYWLKPRKITIGKALGVDKEPLQGTFFQVVKETTCTVAFRKKHKAKDEVNASTTVKYSDLGGLASQLNIIRELVEYPLRSPEVYTKYGLKPPRGVLLKGPPGTGKTMLLKAIANEIDVYHKAISGPEILSKYYGDTEARLKAAFDDCLENSPAILFIDEIDSVCPKRQVANELESRIITTMLTLMDGIGNDSTKPIIVIGCTNKPDNIDPAMRRPGRFDKEILVDIPSPEGRLDILKRIISKVPNSLVDEDFSTIVESTHGFVGADLASLVKEASFVAVKNYKRQRHLGTEKDAISPVLTMDCINACIGHVRPTAIREVALEVPKVKWTDIGGNETIKNKLIECIQISPEKRKLFEQFGIKPPKGILLYGPPGCSKTLMAKAVATESSQNFLAVKGPELFSKWVGESEKLVRELFKKARAAAPSIIFFDEIDSIATKRSQSGGTSVGDRVLTQLLSELDGVESLNNVTIIAATNRPDIIDAALMRPGRIDRILYVPPPDVDARKQIFQNQMKKIAIDPEVTVEQLVEISEGYSGAECVQLCQEAAMCALDVDMSAKFIKLSHFQQASKGIKPQITPQMLNYYESYGMTSRLKHV